MQVSTRSAAAGLLLLAAGLLHAQQRADSDFDATVANPAYAGDGPLVAIDEAHGNFHTLDGNYAPFAALLENDGYRVVTGRDRFDEGALDGVNVLVVANANVGNRGESALADAEVAAVRDWVQAGGSLLLIADHAPFGASVANLGAAFGVEMGQGWVFDVEDGRFITRLLFSGENGRLGTHAVVRGRDDSERVGTVQSFAGQSLGAPEGATVLLKLSPTAREAANTDDLNAEAAAYRENAAGNVGSHSRPVGGRAQALVMPVGDGRLAVLGEAAMFSAQVVTLPGQDGKPVTFKAGMNLPGNDNRQFALNLLHWLSGLLEEE